MSDLCLKLLLWVQIIRVVDLQIVGQLKRSPEPGSSVHVDVKKLLEATSLVESDEGHVQVVWDDKGKPYTSTRLPETLRPEKYVLTMLIRLTEKRFSGHVRIVMKCYNSTSLIILHSLSHAIQEMNLYDVDMMPLWISSAELYPRDELLAIRTEKPMKRGSTYILMIRYTAPFSRSLEGLYKSEYKDKQGKKRVMASTHFEPTSARTMFPCFDEPDFKSIFQITVIHNEMLNVISNMPVHVESVRKDGYTVTEFQPTVRMSTYLVSVAMLDFPFKEKTTESGVKVRVFVAPTHEHRMSFALDVASNVLSFYEKFFGVNYPLPKLDLVAVPEFLSGAMEDWGLVSYRQIYLVYDEKRIPLETKKHIALVIAHELAHQWFGNLVTMKWWNDIWLNEGFANFVEMIGMDHYDPSYRTLDMQVASGWQLAISLDSLRNSHPISQDVQSPSQIDELFDTISYNKGAAILRMLRSFLGHEKFISGVKKYINTHSWNNAETKDLWAALQTVAGDFDIESIMDSWTKQRGFPLIHATLEGTTLRVTQQSFLKEKELQSTRRDEIDPAENMWYVPVTFVTDHRPDSPTTFWLNKEHERSVPVPADIKWLKMNFGVNGFYLVNYDAKLWEALTEQLIRNHTVFTDVDRAGIIHDAFKLACDGILDPEVPLGITRYLRNEEHYLPWTMLRSKYQCIADLLRSRPSYKHFKMYIWSLQKHLLDERILARHKDATPLDIFQQYEVFLFGLKHGVLPEFKPKMEELFRILNETNLKCKQSPELRSLAMLHGFNRSSQREFESMWQLYINSDLDYDRRLLMKGLSVFKSKSQVLLNIDRALDKDYVRAQDGLSFLINVIRGSDASSQVIWKLVMDKWKIIEERYSRSKQLGDLLLEVASSFNSQSDYEMMKKFLEENSLGENSIMERQILEKIRSSMKKTRSVLVRRHRCIVEKWIANEMRLYIPVSSTCS